MQLLLVTAQYFRRRLHERIERPDIQRLRILLVATHRPRADQRGLGLAILDHLDGPAIVVFVLDDARGPAVVAPQAVFVDCIGRVVRAGFGEKRIGHVWGTRFVGRPSGTWARNPAFYPRMSRQNARLLVPITNG